MQRANDCRRQHEKNKRDRHSPVVWQIPFVKTSEGPQATLPKWTIAYGHEVLVAHFKPEAVPNLLRHPRQLRKSRPKTVEAQKKCHPKVAFLLVVGQHSEAIGIQGNHDLIGHIVLEQANPALSRHGFEYRLKEGF
jgi:hypothetical protein